MFILAAVCDVLFPRHSWPMGASRWRKQQLHTPTYTFGGGVMPSGSAYIQHLLMSNMVALSTAMFRAYRTSFVTSWIPDTYGRASRHHLLPYQYLNGLTSIMVIYLAKDYIISSFDLSLVTNCFTEDIISSALCQIWHWAQRNTDFCLPFISVFLPSPYSLWLKTGLSRFWCWSSE